MENIPLTVTLEPEGLEYPQCREHYERNADWLKQHWHLVDDNCYNKFIVVSKGEIIVTIDPYEAIRLLKEKHPEDVPYFTHVLSNALPRIYSPRIVRSK